jgi:hypothetical protein
LLYTRALKEEISHLGEEIVGRFAEIADHFRRRSIHLGNDGSFGALSSKNARMRNIFCSLASLIDNANLSFLLQGAKGTGKSRLIEEFLRLENIYRKLLRLEPTTFCKVYPESRMDILLGLLKKDYKLSSCFYYFVSLESFNMQEQEVLSKLLYKQLHINQNFRLAFGCEQSLSFMVQKGKILSDLVSHFEQHLFQLPSLSERNEDFPTIILDFIQRYSFKKELPHAEVINYLTQLNYPENMDSLSGLIKEALARKPNPALWDIKFVENTYPLARPERTANILDFKQHIRYL